MSEHLEQAPFELDAGDGLKAVHAGENGLVIEGYAARFTTDEQLEAFEEDAFEQAITEANEKGLPLLFHHGALQLGNVKSLELHRGKGVWMRAEVDKPEPGTEAMDIYRKVERGTMKGLSVAGKFFRRPASAFREAHDAAVKIYKARLREISVTPIQVHQDATIATVAAKAFEDGEFQRALGSSDEARSAVDAAVERYGAAQMRLERALQAMIEAHESEGGAAV